MTSKHLCSVRACIWASLRSSHLDLAAAIAFAGIADFMSASPMLRARRTRAQHAGQRRDLERQQRLAREPTATTPAGKLGHRSRSGTLRDHERRHEPRLSSARESAGNGTSTAPSPTGSRPESARARSRAGRSCPASTAGRSRRACAARAAAAELAERVVIEVPVPMR